MTTEQKIDAIKELAKGLTTTELRDLGYDFDDLADEQAKLECEVVGHKFDYDQCGKPEHRFCYHCFTLETARQDKVIESAAGKAELPSESLGSGSKSPFTRIKDWFETNFPEVG